MTEPTEPIEAVNEIRRWMRHWLLRQYGAVVVTEGYVWRDNIKRDARGWPLRDDGTPYPMASYLQGGEYAPENL